MGMALRLGLGSVVSWLDYTISTLDVLQACDACAWPHCWVMHMNQTLWWWPSGDAKLFRRGGPKMFWDRTQLTLNWSGPIPGPGPVLMLIMSTVKKSSTWTLFRQLQKTGRRPCMRINQHCSASVKMVVLSIFVLDHSVFCHILLFWFLFTVLTEHLGSLSTFTHRTHTCGDLTSADVSSRVTVCGWLQRLRYSGMFMVLRDAYGIVQAVISNPEVISECIILRKIWG